MDDGWYFIDRLCADSHALQLRRALLLTATIALAAGERVIATGASALQNAAPT
jgi:hypothetical protein